MSEKEEILDEISDVIQRVNSKIILLRLIVKAKSEYEKYDYDAGRKSLIEAYLVDKNNPIVLRGLGCINQFNGKFNSAIRYFNKALKYSKNKEVEYTLIGMVYYLQDKLNESIKYFNLAIDCNENYERAYEGRNQAMLENHLKITDLQDSLKKYL